MILALLLMGFSSTASAAPSAKALIEAMEKNIRGTSFVATMEMNVKKQDLDRTLGMQIWTKGRDKALVKIQSPAKDKGTSNLRLKFELWQYLPNVEKVIRIPPSLMLQSWMGSNFTNDDLVRMSALDTDYTHKLLGNETMGGFKVAKIECMPKSDAPVVWGKILIWITLKDPVGLKQEFYTERGKLVKTLNGSDVKTFGSHRIPTVLVMKDAKDGQSQTTIRYKKVEFDRNLPDSLFTQQNLKAPVP